mmetsp:Transcript_27361/g.29532  ORF Transcript_27361/g.29532 Transcript_27361/m.29532 type:complete len:224 (+) Transcript_27361:477-1148(+)
MLAFAADNEIVDDNNPEKATVKRKKSRHDNSFDKLLRPVKCLLAVGTTRQYLPEALGLLNYTIPEAAAPTGTPPPLPPSTDVEAIDDDGISKGATTTTATFLSPSQVYLNEITSKYTVITTNSDAANSGATSSSGTPSTPSKAVRHRLACASLVRSLLWPNNNATSKDTTTGHDDSKDDSEVSSVPLAVAMKFEKKLLIELCQSCLGLVESVPPNVMDAINVQ